MSTIPHHFSQKLVEIVRSRDKKRRRRRVGAAAAEVSVEMVEMEGGRGEEQGGENL